MISTGGRGWGSRFSWFWPVIQGDKRDLRGVEELIGPVLGDRFDENAVGYAGDEVANGARKSTANPKML